MNKTYYYVELENVSPIHIGNGGREITDLDVLLDKNGKFYIPGTSIAGACIHSLDKEEQDLLMPVIDGNQSQTKLSPVFFSDAYMVEDTTFVEIRDGIQLDKSKQTMDGAKYDYQVVPAGSHFILRLETINYPKDETDYSEVMDTILSNIQNQNTVVGFKSTRGLGKLAIRKSYKKEFTKDNFEEIFSFDKYNPSKYDEFTVKEKPSDYYSYYLDLVLKGGISIRTYSTTAGEADYEHIHSGNKPVVPGTSWNGMIRASFDKYANMLGQKELTNEVFGYMEGKKAYKSKVYIGESVIEGGEEITQTRTSIDGFHGGAATSKRGLFTETSHYHGTTTLTIRFNQSLAEKMPIIENIMECIFADMNDGLISVGGLASIGRGIFEIKTVKYEKEGKVEDVCLN